MSSVASTALSGMQTAMLRLGASAHNIANLQTPGFRRQEVLQQAGADGGVVASVVPAALPGEALAADVVGQMTAVYLFKASLMTLQTEQRMLGTLLDETA
jgi:flagellar hook protein FlgE